MGGARPVRLIPPRGGGSVRSTLGRVPPYRHQAKTVRFRVRRRTAHVIGRTFPYATRWPPHACLHQRGALKTGTDTVKPGNMTSGFSSRGKMSWKSLQPPEQPSGFVATLVQFPVVFPTTNPGSGWRNHGLGSGRRAGRFRTTGRNASARRPPFPRRRAAGSPSATAAAVRTRDPAGRSAVPSRIAGRLRSPEPAHPCSAPPSCRRSPKRRWARSPARGGIRSSPPSRARPLQTRKTSHFPSRIDITPLRTRLRPYPKRMFPPVRARQGPARTPRAVRRPAPRTARPASARRRTSSFRFRRSRSGPRRSGRHSRPG